METRDKFDMMDALNTATNHGVYYRAENMAISHFNGFDDWNLTDLTNALLPGKMCRTYSIKCNAPHGHLIVTNWITRTFSDDMRALFAYCDGLQFTTGQWGLEAYRVNVEDHTIEIYRGDDQGIRTFSPFALANVKPLKAIPAKWTMRHVYAAIINHQFKSLKCQGVYTDDYAWDDAVNFRRGEIASPLDFIQAIINSPSGWRCYGSGGKVIVNCHHFDNNEFIPAI
jgi:hypothetical protein